MTFGSYFCDGTVLSGNIWQELEPEPKLWTKVEPKIIISALQTDKKRRIFVHGQPPVSQQCILNDFIQTKSASVQE